MVNLDGGFPSDRLGTDLKQLRVGGDYGTALCAACANGHVNVVRILLGKQNIEDE